MISSNTETSLKRFVPLLAFTLAGWWTYKKRENIQESLLFGAIVAVLAYLAVGPIVSSVVSLSARPDAGNYNLNNIPQGWEPSDIARELRDDVYETTINRNNSTESLDLYQRLASLSDDQLVMVYNYWRSKFYSEHNETMVQAMGKEFYGFGTLDDITKSIARRLKARNSY